MASPRERADRASAFARPRARQVPSQTHRHHFHDAAPWPHRQHHDYIYVDGTWGWWPRWYPYWDQSWFVYWWYLYDYYGGDANPDYAEYARDAALREHAPEWGLTISGTIVGAHPHDHVQAHGGHLTHATHGGRFTHATHGGHLAHYQQRYAHPHDYYRDYTVVDGAWWPVWFPHRDPAWRIYWAQLYAYYGGDNHPDYAQYARDAHLRADARRRGWL